MQNSTRSVVLITGAASGIGRQLALTMANDGCVIAALDLHEEALRSLAEELKQKQQHIEWRLADVTDPNLLEQAARSLEAKLGPIDVLIANAGIGIETTGLNYSVGDMNKVLNVNLLGVSNSIGAVLPGMIERKRGHLVAISSIASYRGLPRMLAYCASKSGVNAIMDGLRVELSHLSIDVTTVCPGWIRTPMTANLEGRLDHLMEVDVAVREITYAIRNKLPYYAFPLQLRWSLRILTSLPCSWQDWYIRRMMNQVNVKDNSR